VTLAFFGSAAIVLYTFIGYPAIVAVWARVRPRPARADPDHRPSVSLIIAAYNEDDVIVPRLENVAELDYPRDLLEVIVVADGSDDQTAERARGVPGTTVLHRPERAGKLAAISRAAEVARGEILVFSDANNAYVPETIRELAAPFADPEVGVVAGRKAIDDGQGRPLDRAEGLYWRYESKLKTWESSIGSAIGAPGEVVAFRRAAWRPPPIGTMNEDLVQSVLAAADGWRVVYAPGAISLERASATIGDEAVRRSRLVTGRLQALREILPALLRANPLLTWQFISHKGLRTVVPWALIGAAVSNVGLARRRRWARVPLAVQVVFYVAALLGWREERHGRRSRILYLPFYFCRMNAASLKGVRDFVSGRQEAVWAKVRRG